MFSEEILSRSFIETDRGNPHRDRHRQIRRAHPEVRKLYGVNRNTAGLGLALVVAQVAIAWALDWSEAPVWGRLLAAWGVGAFIAHALFAVMHEATHGLIFGRGRLDRGVLLLANLPLLVPFAIPFAHFHLQHHRVLGQRGLDPDLPSSWEVRLASRGGGSKVLWHLLFPLAQLFRIRGDQVGADSWPGEGWTANAGLQLGVVVSLLWVAPGALTYLAGSVLFIFVLHPLVGRFVQEHYVFEREQETSSYYGPLNRVALNFGYHTEHHDFSAVPWNRLPELVRLAPEAYRERSSHRSWTRLWLRLLFDPTVNIDDRVVRPASIPEAGV